MSTLDNTRSRSRISVVTLRDVKSPLARNIEEVLREKGIKPRTASVGAGLGPSFVRDIFNERAIAPGIDNLQALADYLEVPLVRLTAGTGGRPRIAASSRPAASVDRLPIRHVVQAGNWIEEDEAVQAPRFGPVLVQDPKYRASQWLEEVRGDSMDQIAPEGSLVQVADWADLGLEPKSGQIVVVQRTRLGGALRERSLKVVHRIGDEIELRPKSSNPRWRAPLVLVNDGEDIDDISVGIAGLVIWVHRPIGLPDAT